MFSFSKFEAAGNDFIVIDDRKLQFPFSNKKFIQKICHRRFGIGADGVLLLQKAKKADYKMVIINADGSIASMCGNGLRCIVSFLSTFENQKSYVIESGSNLHYCKIEKGRVKTNLGTPIIKEICKQIRIEDDTYEVHLLDTGVPHAVIFTQDLQQNNFSKLARKIRFHPLFGKEGANVNFVKLASKSALYMRTYERGVEEETFSCGTGAAAAAAISKYLYKMSNHTKVIFPEAQELLCEIEETGSQIHSLWISGECRLIFDGKLDPLCV